MLPVNVVEKDGFKAMVRRFNPRYQLPGRNHFSRVAIPSLYTATKEYVEQKLKSEMEFFASTTDLWSSAAMEPYLSFSIHFIDHSWDLQTFCLQSQFMPQNHSGVNIKECLEDIQQRWNLSDTKLVALTTDSGSNIKLACQLAGWKRLSCFGHNLDLAVKKGLMDSRIDRVAAVCRKIVTAFSQSWKRQRDMATFQEEKGLPKHKLKGDCVTRWGSTLSMMERFVEQQEAIRVVLASDRKVSHLIPRWQDFDVLDSVLAVLQPLRQLTDLLSGEKYVTVSVVKNHLYTEVLAVKTDDTSLTAEVKGRMKDKLESCYQAEEVDELLCLCSFVDPRFMLSVLPSDDQIKHDNLLSDVREHMVELRNNKDLSNSDSSDNPPPSKKVKTAKSAVTLSKILGGKEAAELDSTPLPLDIRAKKELDMYLQLPRLDMDECPLEWWKKERSKFPMLSLVAKKYLCICATSVSSERIFSTGGNVVTDSRTCLAPERVDQLVFFAKNL